MVILSFSALAVQVVELGRSRPETLDVAVARRRLGEGDQADMGADAAGLAERDAEEVGGRVAELKRTGLHFLHGSSIQALKLLTQYTRNKVKVNTLGISRPRAVI